MRLAYRRNAAAFAAYDRVTRQALGNGIQEVESAEPLDPVGKMKTRVAGGEGVVVLAARDIQHVARGHLDFHAHGAARLLMMRVRKAVRPVAFDIDRLIETALINPPGLRSVNLQGKHILRVEMRLKSLMTTE